MKRNNKLWIACLMNLFSLNTFCQWTPQISNTAETLLGVSFTSNQNGFAVGTNGVIKHTANAGVNWTAQTTVTTQVVRDVVFVDSLHGTFVGEAGFILHSVNCCLKW